MVSLLVPQRTTPGFLLESCSLAFRELAAIQLKITSHVTIRAQIICRFSPLASKLLSLFLPPPLSQPQAGLCITHHYPPACLPYIGQQSPSTQDPPRTIYSPSMLECCTPRISEVSSRGYVCDATARRRISYDTSCFQQDSSPSLLCDVWKGFGACRRCVKRKLE